MNGRERIRCAFAHQEPDRVPVFELDVDSPVASEICGRPMWSGLDGYVNGKLRNEMLLAGKADEYYQRKIEDELEVYRKLELDMILAPLPPVVPSSIERLGENRWRRLDLAHGHWWEYAYMPVLNEYTEVDSSLCRNGLPELRRLVAEMEAEDASLANVSFKQLDWLREHAPDLAVFCWADVAIPTGSSWSPVFMEAMVAEPELADRYLAAQHRQQLLVLEACLQRDVDVVFGGMDFCGMRGPMISPAHYRRFLQPRFLEITGLCHRYGVPYFRHEDGRLGALEEDFILHSGLDGYHAIEPGAGMDIFYLKERYGRQLTLLGNIDCANTLVFGSEAEVRQEVREKIRRCAPGGGYILSSSNSIHSGVPTRNYRAMLQAARECGSYPVG